MKKFYFQEVYTEPFDDNICEICGATNSLEECHDMGEVNDKVYCVKCIEVNNLIDEKTFQFEQEKKLDDEMKSLFREKHFDEISNRINGSLALREVNVDFSTNGNEVNYEWRKDSIIRRIKNALINAEIDLEFYKEQCRKNNKSINVDFYEKKVKYLYDYLNLHNNLSQYESQKKFTDSFEKDFVYKYHNIIK